MALFSERNGYTQLHDVLQLESASRELRVAIYNMLFSFFGEFRGESFVKDTFEEIWDVLWHRPLNEFPCYMSDFYIELKSWMWRCVWYEIYDLLECILVLIEETEEVVIQSYGSGYAYSDGEPLAVSNAFRTDVNEVLNRESSGYRLVGTSIVPITDEAEMAATEAVLGLPDEYATVRTHMSKALSLLANKRDPDYPNVIKESISAVEAAVAVISGTAPKMGTALNILGQKEGVHPALIKGWKEIYGFTSDGGGIRHAAHGEPIEIDSALAKYMVVSCSAFVNYLYEHCGVR